MGRENNPCEAPKNSPASWCKKSESKGAEERSADFLLEAEKRGSPPKSEKRQLLGNSFKNSWGERGGGAALLRKESSEISGKGFAESAKESQGGLPRRFCESARNDEFLDSLLRKCSAQNDKIKEIRNDKNGVRVAESALEIFYQICKIPHPSGQTKDLQKFIVDFLRACGCEVKSDSAGNIYALKGAPRLVFQAHYDMVLVGEKVVPFIENGFLKARNSSLGADNGAAVATLLHLAKTRKNIEILLTNDEEIGMLGANNLALQTHSKKMINLDSECVEEICVGCAGGFDADIDLGNLSWGMQFRTCEKFWESADLGLALSQNFSQIQKPHRHYFDCDLQSESATKHTQNTESSLDSANHNNPSLRADSQNLRGNPPYENTQNLQCGWLLRNARKSYGLPRSHSLARNDDTTLDSALSKHYANSSIVDEFLRSCEVSDADRTNGSSRKRGEREREKSPQDEFADSTIYEFSAHNFKGGHSGIDIDKNIKNAIVELLYALDSARQMGEFEILEISGGEARNSIPINARAIIRTKTPINPTQNAESMPHIAIKKLAHYTPKQKPLKGAVIAYLLRLHNGIYEMEQGSVTSSLNFSIISNEALKIMVRGNKAECLDRQILRLKYLFGEAVEISGFYNAWETNSASCGDFLGTAPASCKNAESSAESTLLSTLSRIYTKHKIPFKIIQIHAGLECGILKDKCALDEVISIGPTILHPHSKGEMMDLASFARFCDIVEDLCEA